MVTQADIAKAGPRTYQPPKSPMRLRRTLHYRIDDTRHIAVAREWRIRFLKNPSGCSILGEQTDVRIEVPSWLDRLALIERERSTSCAFPIELDLAGLLQGMGPFLASADVAHAIDISKEILAQRSISRSALIEQKAHLEELAAATLPAVHQLPDDLFFPRGRTMRHEGELALPDGDKGTFKITYEARPAMGKGWLEKARRRIVTRQHGTERLVQEHWEMSPI